MSQHGSCLNTFQFLPPIRHIYIGASTLGRGVGTFNWWWMDAATFKSMLLQVSSFESAEASEIEVSVQKHCGASMVFARTTASSSLCRGSQRTSSRLNQASGHSSHHGFFLQCLTSRTLLGTLATLRFSQSFGPDAKSTRHLSKASHQSLSVQAVSARALRQATLSSQVLF